MKSKILALTLGYAVVAFGDYAHTVECSPPARISESFPPYLSFPFGPGSRCRYRIAVI